MVKAFAFEAMITGSIPVGPSFKNIFEIFKICCLLDL